MTEKYSSAATERCERALGTLMRGIGQPWRHRVCLVGGLVPLYLVRGDGYDQPVHVGSTDVDVIHNDRLPESTAHLQGGGGVRGRGARICRCGIP